MTASPRPFLLGPNQYGKAEIRVLKTTRDGATHHVRDLNVSVALAGDMDAVHYDGSNAGVLPTDTAKNTVFAFARRHGIESPERFGIELARHFTTTQDSLHRARIRIEEYAWERTGDTGHSFVRAGRETRLAQVTCEGGDVEVLSGLTGMTVMNTTDSEFTGYVKDAYTTLPEDRDRILATAVTAWWRHRETNGAAPGPGWDDSYMAARTHLLDAFAGTYSLSLQQTLYRMGAHVLELGDGIDEIRLSLPNKHHFRLDLTPFDLSNEAAEGAVYFAADRPYGLIEATVLRAGAAALIPADLANL
ncbi:factor-independent urate hydroxylase [Streptomyces polyrhachis]|uniref:Uricase n=1 Tax=Streptomyces polyrhachis TaxID=1282885 RepID=A0ABW2GJ89_9ACTN